MAASQSNASNIFFPVVLGAVNDPGLFWEIGHSFLGERGPDDIAGQVFHGGFFPGMDTGTAKDLNSGMSPGFFPETLWSSSNICYAISPLAD
jgi:hypothetical protein